MIERQLRPHTKWIELLNPTAGPGPPYFVVTISPPW